MRSSQSFLVTSPTREGWQPVAGVSLRGERPPDTAFSRFVRVPGCQRLKSPLECVVMTTVALTAHFDGEKVQFDEPCLLDANARLMVVVLPPDDERRDWSRLSAGQLAKAYGDTEPEYTAADLRP